MHPRKSSHKAIVHLIGGLRFLLLYFKVKKKHKYLKKKWVKKTRCKNKCRTKLLLLFLLLGLKLFLLKRNVFALLVVIFEEDEDAVAVVPTCLFSNKAVVVVETFRLNTGDLSLNLNDLSAL